MNLADKSHPYWHLESILREESSVATVHLSYYLYRPQSLLDQRTVFQIRRTDFLNPAYFEQFLSQCPAGYETAFHSLVTCRDENQRHLPMVDMATEELSDLSEVNAFVQDNSFHGFVWFESGRSFHGYGTRLVTYQQWIELMGKLLLCNGRRTDPVVDPRWVGHRLLGGYAALRWTRNTPQYLSIPRRLQPRNLG